MLSSSCRPHGISKSRDSPKWSGKFAAPFFEDGKSFSPLRRASSSRTQPRTSSEVENKWSDASWDSMSTFELRVASGDGSFESSDTMTETFGGVDRRVSPSSSISTPSMNSEDGMWQLGTELPLIGRQRAFSFSVECALWRWSATGGARGRFGGHPRESAEDAFAPFWFLDLPWRSRFCCLAGTGIPRAENMSCVEYICSVHERDLPKELKHAVRRPTSQEGGWECNGLSTFAGRCRSRCQFSLGENRF